MRPSRSTIVALATVPAVLAMLAWVEVDVARRLSFTFDEATHVGAGVSYVEHHEVLLNPEHPPLVKLISGLCVHALGAREGSAGALYGPSTPFVSYDVQASYGEELLLGANPDFKIPGALRGCDSVVVAARLPLIAFPLVLALVTFLWARRRFGLAGGLVSLALVATYPDVLGHGALVTTDVPIACLGLLSALCLERLRERPGVGNVLAFSLAFALAVATKFSIVFLTVGFTATFIGTLGTAGRGVRRSLALAVPAMCAAVLLVLAIAYQGANPVVAYLEGVRRVNANHPAGYQGQLFGSYSSHFWTYFLAAPAFKAPVGTLALLFLAAGVFASSRRARGSSLEEVALHAPPFVLFVATSLLADFLGTRYVIPVAAFLFVSAGRLAVWAGSSWRRWGAVVLLLGSNVVGSVRDHPFHQSSTNIFAGPPETVYELFDDSNQDWGGGLKALAEWQREQGISSELVVASPQLLRPRWLAAYGVKGEAVAVSTGGDLDFLYAPLRGRVYAVSAHLLSRARGMQAVLVRDAQEHRVRPPRSLWLGTVVKPSAVVGGGYLIFDLRRGR